MSIALPIISNILIAALLVLGFFIGKNNGWKKQLIKSILVIGAAVGMYFLTPIVANALLQIEFITSTLINTPQLLVLFRPIVYVVLTILFYLVITAVMAIIFAIIKRAKKEKVVKQKKVNMAKSVKLTKIEKANRRKIRRADKRALRKAHKAELKAYAKKHRVSRIFGGIIGVITAFLMGFIIFLPINGLQKVAEPESGLEQVYDTSLYGVIDFDLSDKLLEDIITRK